MSRGSKARNLSESIHLKVTPQDAQALEALANQRALTMSDIVREAIRAYLTARTCA